MILGMLTPTTKSAPNCLAASTGTREVTPPSERSRSLLSSGGKIPSMLALA